MIHEVLRNTRGEIFNRVAGDTCTSFTCSQRQNFIDSVYHASKTNTRLSDVQCTNKRIYLDLRERK